MMVNYLVFISALFISCVSAYFSITGLTALFSGSYWPVIIMGVALEIGKLTSASWLYRHWTNASIFIRTYLIIAITILMMISSMGIFGYLSKSHIDQSINSSADNNSQISIITNKVESEKTQVNNIQKQIDQIDSAIDNLVKNNRASTSLAQQSAQRKTRDQLVAEQNVHSQNILTLNNQKVQYQTQQSKNEVDIGPLRYVAALFYKNPDAESLDSTVRVLILIIVSVFDPLAIILLISANIGFLHSKKKPLTNPEKHDILEIDKNIFG